MMILDFSPAHTDLSKLRTSDTLKRRKSVNYSPRTPSGGPFRGAVFVAIQTGGGSLSLAHPWLISQHASGASSPEG